MRSASRSRMAFMKRLALRAALAVSCLLVTLAAVLTVATPASAHAVLISSSPTADTVVPTAPAQIVLTFSETVREVPGRIRVIGPDGKRIDRGRPKFEGSMVTITVDQNVPRGTYLVSYRVISADSHPVGGGFTYSVGERTTPPDEADSGSDVNTVVATAVGHGQIPRLRRPRAARRPRAGAHPALASAARADCPRRLIWTGFGLIVASTLAGLWLQVPYTAGGGLFEVDLDGLIAVLGSQFGAAQLARWHRGAARCDPADPADRGRHRRARRPADAVGARRGRASSPGRSPGTRPPPRSRPSRWRWTPSTWSAWRSGWAGCSCSCSSCCAGRRARSSARSCPSGPAGRRSPSRGAPRRTRAGLLEIGSLNALLARPRTGGWCWPRSVWSRWCCWSAAISRQLIQAGGGGRTGRAGCAGWSWVELVIAAVVLGVTVDADADHPGPHRDHRTQADPAAAFLAPG